MPRLAPALAQAAPAGAALETRRLLEVRDLLLVARSVRVHLRRDPDRFALLAGVADGLPEAPEVEAALTTLLDDGGQVREDASPALAAARRATRELRTRLEAQLLKVVRDPANAGVVGEQYVTVRNGRYVVPIRTAAAWTFDGRGAGPLAVRRDGLRRAAVRRRAQQSPPARVEDRGGGGAPRARGADGAHPRRTRRRSQRWKTRSRAPTPSARRPRSRSGTRARGPRSAATRSALLAARHPLLLLSGRPVVPVDIRVRAGQRGLAITGPNAGGKTVALKTLGLCALMAQAGLFVPAAEGSRLPCFAAVLADIGDEQSIERDLSTFTGHAENLAAIASRRRSGAAWCCSTSRAPAPIRWRAPRSRSAFSPTCSRAVRCWSSPRTSRR